MTAMNTNQSAEGLARSQAFWKGHVRTPQEVYADQVAMRQRLYGDTPAPRTLAEYQSAPRRSKWDQSGTTPNESDIAYCQRIRDWLPRLELSLPADEFQRVVEQYRAALQRIEGGQLTHEQVQAADQARASGSNVGLFGLDFRGRNQAVQPNTSGVPTSSVAIAAMLREREATNG
jgi:hypothetical protein